ncbi:MAG: hypothetical protein A2Y12_17105 [Planctomycetes bacterium GWF2_42_9]|nr:MAG: hypothetical protein A2Y12_17105 [Planctomycetes bacterium GWF2_42_9]
MKNILKIKTKICFILLTLIGVSASIASPSIEYKWDSVNYLPTSQGWTQSGSCYLTNDLINEALAVSAYYNNNVAFTKSGAVFNDPNGWTLTAVVRVRHADTYNWSVVLAVDTGAKCWNWCFYKNIHNLAISGVHSHTTSGVDFIKLIPDIGEEFHIIQMIYDPCSDTSSYPDHAPELYVDGYADKEARLYARDGGGGWPGTGKVLFGSGNSEATSDVDWQYVSFEVGQHPAISPEPAIVETRWSRGQDILMRRGLQIQAQAFPTAAVPSCFSLNRWAESNFTTANFGWVPDQNIPALMGLAPGIPWGKWGNGVSETEMSYYSNLVSLQYGDEQDLELWQERQDAIVVLSDLKNRFPDVLSYTDQYFNQVDNESMELYMTEAKPDMLMQNGYPYRAGQSVTDLYQALERYRLFSLQGNGDAAKPIPHGIYTQGVIIDGRKPSESEIRLNQFAPWTFGCKFVSCFVYNSDVAGESFQPLLFTGDCDDSPTAEFYIMKELNRQSRNIGNSLVRLQNYDVRMKVVSTSKPWNMQEWTSASHPETYMTNLAVTNTGNGTGDVFIGYFKPVHELFDGPDYSNQIYFMILNGLADSAKTATQGRQQIDITFDFGTTGITSLQKVSRDTGLVETVPLASLGGSVYKLTLTTLDGGTGELFKFNTGAPFINGPAYCGDPAFGFLAGDINGADGNRDCAVNFLDIAQLGEDWYQVPTWYVNPIRLIGRKADISGPEGKRDGVVDLYDLDKLSEGWLDSSTPTWPL